MKKKDFFKRVLMVEWNELIFCSDQKKKKKRLPNSTYIHTKKDQVKSTEEV